MNQRALSAHHLGYAQADKRLHILQLVGLHGSISQAARAAGLPVVITSNSFTAHHDFTGALRVLPDLSQVTLQDVQAWHAEAVAGRSA